jgi:hypothetical protein
MINERLKKLLLMLSSDHPGEIASAARAIGRTLKEAGTDWHGLVGRLSDPASNNDPGAAADLHEMRSFCLQRADLLRPREHEFLNSLATWSGDLTEKQHHWLVAIYGRLHRHSK